MLIMLTCSPTSYLNHHLLCKHVGCDIALKTDSSAVSGVLWRRTAALVYLLSPHIDQAHPELGPHCLCLTCIEAHLPSYMPDWWAFASRSAFRSTDTAAEQRCHARCARGIPREYMYLEYVLAYPAGAHLIAPT
jgi:hypothetical protein